MAPDSLAEFAEALANPLEYLSKIERNEAMLAILEDFEGQVNVFALYNHATSRLAMRLFMKSNLVL